MVQARSIGQRAADILTGLAQGGRVLACFDRVWDLVAGDGHVLALAWRGVPDGPFNILLDHMPGPALPAGTRFVISDGCIRFPGLVEPVELSGARRWDPRPDWAELGANYPRIAGNLPALASLLAAEAPSGSLEDIWRGAAHPRRNDVAYACEIEYPVHPAHPAYPVGVLVPSGAAYVSTVALSIAAVLAAASASDEVALRAAVAGLCGLGPGLTPSGDDWLAGWLLALHLDASASASPSESRLALARSAVRSAIPSTTLLSGAFLACACEGEADAGWHRLLGALAYGAAGDVKWAARAILAHGATSGADMLAGFLAHTYFESGGPES